MITLTKVIKGGGKERWCGIFRYNFMAENQKNGRQRYSIKKGGREQEKSHKN